MAGSKKFEYDTIPDPPSSDISSEASDESDSPDSESEDGVEYLIQRVVKKDIEDGKVFYTLRWLGYSSKSDARMVYNPANKAAYISFEQAYSEMKVPECHEPATSPHYPPQTRLLAPRTLMYLKSKWPCVVCSFATLPPYVREKLDPKHQLAVRFFGSAEWRLLDENAVEYVRPLSAKTATEAKQTGELKEALSRIPEKKQQRFLQYWELMWMDITDEYVMGMPIRLTEEQRRELKQEGPLPKDVSTAFSPCHVPPVPKFADVDYKQFALVPNAQETTLREAFERVREYGSLSLLQQEPFKKVHMQSISALAVIVGKKEGVERVATKYPAEWGLFLFSSFQTHVCMFNFQLAGFLLEVLLASIDPWVKGPMDHRGFDFAPDLKEWLSGIPSSQSEEFTPEAKEAAEAILEAFDS